MTRFPFRVINGAPGSNTGRPSTLSSNMRSIPRIRMRRSMSIRKCRGYISLKRYLPLCMIVTDLSCHVKPRFESVMITSCSQIVLTGYVSFISPAVSVTKIALFFQQSSFWKEKETSPIPTAPPPTITTFSAWSNLLRHSSTNSLYKASSSGKSTKPSHDDPVAMTTTS